MISHVGHLFHTIFYNSTLNWTSCSDVDFCLSVIICSYKLCGESLLLPSEGLSVLFRGSTSKIEVLVPSVAQIIQEGSSVWVTSLFLTPHVVVIRSAYSCFSPKQINIYYSHSSIQLRGLTAPPQTMQRSHIKKLCKTVLFSVTIIFTTLPVWGRGGSQRNALVTLLQISINNTDSVCRMSEQAVS